MSSEKTNELPEEIQLHAAYAINKLVSEYCPSDIEACENTSGRWVDAMGELLSGYGAEPKLTKFEAKNRNMIVKRNIKYYSLCRHHLLPFYGHVNIAYVPHQWILGLSKLSRIVNIYSRRLQIQENLTEEIASKLRNVLGTSDVMVVITGEHLCEKMRGTENDEDESVMVTSSIGGIFTEEKVRQEALKLMGRID
jgi:GTP cyclohydrolase I